MLRTNFTTQLLITISLPILHLMSVLVTLPFPNGKGRWGAKHSPFSVLPPRRAEDTSVMKVPRFFDGPPPHKKE